MPIAKCQLFDRFCLQTWGSSVARLFLIFAAASFVFSPPFSSSLSSAPQHAIPGHFLLTQQKPPMATRPTLRSSDGARPRSKSGTGSGTGRPPTSPRSSDPSRPSSAAAAAASDKPVPSFLRPTVSSSMHCSGSSSSLASPSSSSSTATAKRSADKAPAQPVGAPRPITPKKDKAPVQPVGAPRPITPKKDKAPVQPVVAPRPITPKDKAKAKVSASTSASRWAAVSPRQLMQRASNAFKASSRSRSKKSKEAAAAAASASSSKGSAGASSARAKGQTARAQPVEEQQQQPQTPAEPSPAVTPVEVEDPVLLEPGAAEQNEQDVATAHEGVSTDITTVPVRHQDEQVGAGKPKGKAEEGDVTVEEKIIQVEAEQVKTELQEERPQSSEVVDTETEVQKNTDDGSPAVVGEEAAAKEAVMPEGEGEPTTSTVEEKVVVEESQQAEVAENSEENAFFEEPKQETSVISEEPKEETSVISEEPKEAADPAPVQKQEEVSDEPKVAAGSSASAPTTPLRKGDTNDDDDVVEAVPKQVSASEPVTPVAEGISKGKEVMETPQQSASAPTTPAGAAKKKSVASTKQATIPEGTTASALAFKGRKVKTAMEKRSEEEQPKKKEVALSNDVIEEAKRELMEKRKSKVKALVGAFETVMDSPRSS